MDLIFGGLVVGLTSGGLFAIFGVLLTLTARLTRVVNLSQVAVGVFGAYLSINLTRQPLPQWLSVTIAIVAAALLSAGVGWVISRWLGEASTTARSAVTVGTLLGLMSVSYVVFGTQPQQLRPLVIGPLFSIGNVAVTKVGVLLLGMAIVIAFGSWALLTWTRLGVRLRAVADRQTAAELMGVNVRLLQVLVWAFTGAIAGLVISIVGNAQAAGAGSMITLLIPAAAAALIGAFRSLWLTVVGGLLVGGVQGMLTSIPGLTLIADWVPIILIVIFLLWNQRKEVWDAAR
ncbi:branched-chain amino acid ABC transporter permease [Microbacterium sp. F2]|uniref:branched-chain amino acid ABC transporter permease n=1 Tax=Microbacterium sp. F2 TaxID=3422228 RepID=UPI003FCF7EF9